MRASDGDDRITCEGDAGSVMNAPAFDMYHINRRRKGKGSSTVPAKGKSFHETYEKSYTTKKRKTAPVTGVLVPRPDIAVI